ncbi:MAG: hypothetical protein IPJ20_05625 [Flammeovirgaceae bacterium]|nr:hypothetical protein [Flammeovirgaceae bacterium]
MVDGVNFIGTLSDTPLAFRVNGVPSGRIELSYMNANTSFGHETLQHNTGNQNTAMGVERCQATQRDPVIPL